MTTESKKFRVNFTTKMPGAQKATTYPVDVDALDMVEAVAKAEAEWDRIVSHYTLQVGEVESSNPGKSGAE